LSLKQICYLKADYPSGGEKPVDEEAAYFTETLPACGIEPRQIKVDEDELQLLEVLKEGNFDVLHIACHGQAEHDDIERSRLILGEKPALPGQPPTAISVEPRDVRSEANLKKRHPIVFLNACESGRLGPSLTAWAGWPSAFLETGAGAFVGTSWPVRGTPAKVFAETFYEALGHGMSLAEATTAARASAKKLGDASWLAYKVFGHPLARAV
jgi:CHAT domain-containing protein